jgi:hypothetical protein
VRRCQLTFASLIRFPTLQSQQRRDTLADMDALLNVSDSTVQVGSKSKAETARCIGSEKIRRIVLIGTESPSEGEQFDKDQIALPTSVRLGTRCGVNTNAFVMTQDKGRWNSVNLRLVAWPASTPRRA